MSKHSARNENEKTKSAEIGRRLYELRLKYGEKVNKPNISQGNFGAALGIGGDTQGSRDTLVGRLERGEYDIKPSELQKYSQLCGVSIDYIVNGSEYEEPTQEITFLDLCNLIIKLDKCGLIRLTNDYGIVFLQPREPDNDIEYDDYGREIKPDPERLADRDSRIISKAMRKFLRSYSAAQGLLDTPNLPQKKWLAEKAVEGAINDFEFSMSIASPALSADRLLQEMKDGTLAPSTDILSFMNIPDTIDDPFPDDDQLPFN